MTDAKPSFGLCASTQRAHSSPIFCQSERKTSTTSAPDTPMKNLTPRLIVSPGNSRESTLPYTSVWTFW